VKYVAALSRKTRRGKMASDYNEAGVIVSHNIYILTDVARALIQGWYNDTNEHRHIAASKDDIKLVSLVLQGLLSSINETETTQKVDG
jgi:hypothetical protein